MATQTKKVVTGPLTAHTEKDGRPLQPAVMIVFPDNESASLSLAELGPEVIQRLAVHGMSQKIGDSYAGAQSVEGETPLAYAKRRVAEVIEQLKAGEWRVTGEGGPAVTLLGRALARAEGQTVEAAMEVLREREAALDNGESKKADNPWKQFQATLRAHPAIKKATADIKAEDAAKAQEAAKGLQTTEETPSLGSLFGS